MKIRIGSRESKLAVIQSQIVMDAIKKYNPDIELELVTMKTTGDIILDKTLDKIGGKGLFVKELDRALLNNEVDITVHSFKDMPMEVDQRLPVVAVSKRETPNDVLVLPKGETSLDLNSLDKPIGCSSARRKTQLKTIYPNCRVEPVRGNVLTRLEKLDRGEFSALVLAHAGLKRLSLEDRISRIFTVQESIPAACQGILAIQARAGFDVSFLSDFNDDDTYTISIAERSFVKALNGGCSSPIASYAVIDGDMLTLTGMYVNEKTESVHIKTMIDNKSNAVQLGEKLAIAVKSQS